MQWLPFEQMTFVLPYKVEELTEKLKVCINPREPSPYPNALDIINARQRKTQQLPFDGYLKDKGFVIGRSILSPEHFSPLIQGKIEKTSKGCLLFIRFQLFGSTRFFLWMGIGIFLITAIVGALQGNYFSLLLSILFFGAAYAVVLLNFRQKVQISKKLLEKILF